MMTFIKTITQGGQVHIHQLRMLKQVILTGLVVSLIAGVGCFAWKAYHLPRHAWQMAYETYWAQFMLVTTPMETHKTVSQDYTPMQGKSYKRSSLSVLKDPLLQQTTQQMEQALKKISYDALKIAGYVFLIIMGFWFFRGRSHKKPHHERGATHLHWRDLANLFKKKGQASDLKLGKLPLIKNSETSHILVTGTTGSGKTNTFHTLLPQIRARGDRLIIVDVTGTYVSRYYNAKTDILLNPLDTRSLPWHPWADCQVDSHYDVLAESLIQAKESSKDPFWDNAARVVLKTALRKFEFQGNADIGELTTFLLSSSEKDFEDFFKGTEAATFTVKNNEKTTGSIRSVLSSQIEGLRQLDSTTESFSLRNWVMNEPLNANAENSETGVAKHPNWIFITARADQRKALIPLISTWMDIAINALMVLPEDHSRRLWFVIDELAALQALPSLKSGLAEARKYGGCFLVGFQSKPQLEEIYGKNGAESMLDLFNTKLFFRCTEPSTQQWISKVLGDKEEAEAQENISYGANSTRDGVSLSRHTRQKPLVLPAELSQLKDLECYIKLPGDYPCTKLQTSFQKAKSLRTEPFLLKPEKKRVYDVPAPVEANASQEITEIQEVANQQSGEDSIQAAEVIPENKEELV